MHFYKDKDDIFCAPCAGREGFPLEHDEGGPGNLKYVEVTPEGVFKCASCDERFMVYDGRVFMEVTQF